jgi:hypothetical protein
MEPQILAPQLYSTFILSVFDISILFYTSYISLHRLKLVPFSQIFVDSKV